MENGCGFEYDERHKVWVTGCGQEIDTKEDIQDLIIWEN